MESSDEDNKSLEHHCNAPSFECLEFSLTVSDDGDWNNVSATLKLDNLTGTESIGPDMIQIQNRSNGHTENKGDFPGSSKNLKIPLPARSRWM